MNYTIRIEENPPTKHEDTSFYSLIHSKIRVCSRNKTISSYLNSSVIPDISRAKTFFNSRPSEKLNASELFKWFVISKFKMRDLIPDIELIKYREICLEMISQLGNCCEAHFGIGKMCAHESNFDEALQHIQIASSEDKNDQTYLLWIVALGAFRANSKKKALQAKDAAYSKYHLGLLRSLQGCIELLWTLLILAQEGYLKTASEIESPEHFAAKIYQIDRYYGGLAWSKVFLKTDAVKGVNLLRELIDANRQQPEAYLVLWEYYYTMSKNYKYALQVSECAFLCTLKSEYSVILALNYARSLFKNGHIRGCLELLQLEYTNHSQFTVLLYHYGRFCIKSQDLHFLGSAIGALEECLNTSSETRHGQIFYWLAKAYVLADEKLEAFEYSKKAIPIISSLIDKAEQGTNKNLCNKLNEMKDITRQLHLYIISINALEVLLKESRVKIDEYKLHCNTVKSADLFEGQLYEAKLWWKVGNAQKAKEVLYSQLDVLRPKLRVFFLLVEIFQVESNFEEILAINKEMMNKCRNPIIPVQTWIKVNMIYAKCLLRQQKHEEALVVYKSLAQVGPIPFIPDVRYTRELQRACTREDLDNVLMRIKYRGLKYSYLSNNTVDLYTKRSQLAISKNFLASLDEEGKVEEELCELSKSVSTDMEFIGSRAPEPLSLSRANSVPYGESVNIGFSVTTSYEYLYKIGKVCAKFKFNLEEGIHAIHDFLNTHNYWKRDGIEINEEIKAKAKFWLGMLYFESQQISQVEEVFQDILSMLFQLGKKKMGTQALKLLKKCKSCVRS